MAMQLTEVVPFGRSLDEYRKMFNLTQQDLQKSILSVADGPASFNAEGTLLGANITSVDPLYSFTTEQIRDRFNQVVDLIIKQVRNTPEDWVWAYHHSPDDLKRNRERTLELFCQDFAAGKIENRYQIGELPTLLYQNQQFELGLCSHFLFLYSAHLDESFHFQAIKEMLRVCKEVRIFPLLTLSLETSPYLVPIVTKLEENGYNCEIQRVSYEFQRGGNQMLKILN
ncbi:MAG: SAM-dependent methyltransferase [Snowella sp.]|nr:SAM-dependent methyltransferase [Snowella sp.]